MIVLFFFHKLMIIRRLRVQNIKIYRLNTNLKEWTYTMTIKVVILIVCDKGKCEIGSKNEN